MPRVAVVIPTYNRASSLKRALDSVQAQTYTDLETIVVDDGSDDDTASVVERYAECRYIKVAHSGLPAVARNAGIRVADSEHVAFLDSDDEWSPPKLETQVGLIATAAYGLSCTNALTAWDNERPEAMPYLRADQGHTGQVLKKLLEDNFVITSTAMVRRDLLDRVGGFREDPALLGVEDYDLWLRLAAVSDFCYLPAPLAVYRRSIVSLSLQHSALSHWRSMADIFVRMDSIVDARNEALTATLNQQLDGCRRAICEEYLAQSQFREFMKSLAAFCGRRPWAAAKYLAVKATGRLVARPLRRGTFNDEDSSHG